MFSGTTQTTSARTSRPTAGWPSRSKAQATSHAARDLGMSEKQLRDALWQLWSCGLPGYGPGDLIDLAFGSREYPGPVRTAMQFLINYRSVDFRAGEVIDLGAFLREAGPEADEALTRLEVDNAGLDAMDRRYLSAIAVNYGGGPVGIETMAAALSEPRDAIEEIIEPYLIQQGFLQRTPRGRLLTAHAFKHLGLAEPARESSQFQLFRGDEDE